MSTETDELFACGMSVDFAKTSESVRDGWPDAILLERSDGEGTEKNMKKLTWIKIMDNNITVR